jgi:branched-chain amino acid transport system permease protein
MSGIFDALDMLVGGIAIGGIYGLVAMGFVLIIKASKILNFSQGAMMMLMAYVFYSLLVQFQLPLWVAFPLVVLIAVIIGILVERVFLRPMISQPLLAVVMMTIALSLLFDGTVCLFWQTQTYSLPRLLPGDVIRLGTIAFSQEYLLAFIIVALLSGLLTAFFLRTKLGLAIRCVGEDEQASQAIGIRPMTVYRTAWVASFVIATVSGILFASMQSVSYTINNLGLKVFAVVLLGGLDSLIGAAVGGIVVGILESVSAWYLDPMVGGGVREIAPYVVMIVVLIIRPSGLFGSPKIERV